MTELEIYKLVNQCETLEELSDVILDLADENGMLQGKTNKFNAGVMAAHCLNFNNLPANCLTRNYGIRQQAVYCIYNLL